MLLDNENFVEMKSRKILGCEFKIGKNGIGIVAKKTTLSLELKKYNTVSVFVDKTNPCVVGVRFYKGLNGDLKIFNKRSLQICCKSLLSRYNQSYIGEYRLEKFQDGGEALDCIFVKEAQNGDN